MSEQTWHDTSSYSRSEPRIPNCWRYGETKLSVHRHIDHPGRWHWSHHDLNVKARLLTELDPDEAKKEALMRARQHLRKMFLDLEEA